MGFMNWLRSLWQILFGCAIVGWSSGCGGGAKIEKPENPIPKMDLDEKSQKTAGDFAPGP